MSSTLGAALRHDAIEVEQTLTKVLDGRWRTQQDASEVEQILTKVSSTVGGALKQDASEVEQALTRVSGTVEFGAAP